MATSRTFAISGVALGLALVFCTGAGAMGVSPCSHTASSQQSCSCNDATSNAPKSGSIVNGNLTVPNGDRCTLNHVTVTKNVSLGKNSSLKTCGNTSCGTKIMHDFSANGSADIDLSDTSVGHDLNVQKADTICLRNGSAVFHDVTIQGTTGTAPPAASGCFGLNQNSICDSQVGHDLNLLSNVGTFAIGTTGPTACAAPGTVDVGHDLHVSHNATVSIDNDDIDHNLNCDNNNPKPTNTQTANALGGKAMGQCASFTTTKDKDEAPPMVTKELDAVDGGGPTGFSFHPTMLTVPQGATLLFKNKSAAAPHGITWDTNGAPPNLPVIQPGGHESATLMSSPGTYNYHCTVHGPMMNGSITVTP